MPEATVQAELTPTERYVAASAVSDLLGKVMEVLYDAEEFDDDYQGFPPGVQEMLSWDTPEKPILESERLFGEVFPEDPPGADRELGPAWDDSIVLEARLLLLLAAHSDDLIREANRLLGVRKAN